MDIMSVMNAMNSMNSIKDLQDMNEFNPDVFKKLLAQQMEGLKKGKPMMPSSWGLGKPLTEEEFKKMKAEKGASVIKTVKTDGNKVTTEQDSPNPMASGTIEEVLNRVREEKAKATQEPETVSSADLRKKLKARLQAKQVRRMSQHAVSSIMSKKMPQTQPKNDETNNDTNDENNENENENKTTDQLDEIEEIIEEVVAEE